MKVRVVLLIALFAILSAALTLPNATALPAQAQDPTLSYLESEKLRRQGELASTAQAIRAMNSTATAVRLATVQGLHDQATATALASNATATEDARLFSLTATADARATQIAGATATQVIVSTATAQAIETKSAWATSASLAATATADAVAFAEQSQRRQAQINQAIQAVYVLGGLVLIVLASGLTYLALRWIWAWVKAHLPQAKPVQVVEVVKQTDERPLTQEEVRETIDEMSPDDDIIVTIDAGATERMYEHLRREGVAPAAETA